MTLINAHSVKNKVIALCESLNEKNVTACAVTETWLKSEDNVIKQEFMTNGYNLIHL